MNHRKPATVVLTVIAYVLTTFAVQGTSHFAINAEHFAAIPIMRAAPMVPLGIVSMVIQGLIFAWLYPVYAAGASSVRRGIAFSWMIGGFLASYIVFGEAGKYAIPSVPAWIAVETSAAFVQYTLLESGLVSSIALRAWPARASPHSMDIAPMNLGGAFKAKLWRYKGPGGWHFVTLPERLAPPVTHRWGRTPVDAVVDGYAWKTSVWRDKRKRTLLAVPKRARAAKEDGDSVNVTIRFRAL